MSSGSSGDECDSDIGGAADIAEARRRLSSGHYPFGTGRAADLYRMADQHEENGSQAGELTGVWARAAGWLKRFGLSMEAASMRGQAYGMSCFGELVVMGELVEPPTPSHEIQELANQIGIERSNRAMGHGGLYELE